MTSPPAQHGASDSHVGRRQRNDAARRAILRDDSRRIGRDACALSLTATETADEGLRRADINGYGGMRACIADASPEIAALFRALSMGSPIA